MQRHASSWYIRLMDNELKIKATSLVRLTSKLVCLTVSILWILAAHPSSAQDGSTCPGTFWPVNIQGQLGGGAARLEIALNGFGTVMCFELSDNPFIVGAFSCPTNVPNLPGVSTDLNSTVFNRWEAGTDLKGTVTIPRQLPGPSDTQWTVWFYYWPCSSPGQCPRVQLNIISQGPPADRTTPVQIPFSVRVPCRAPIIDHLSPIAGLIGTQVTIAGQHFGPSGTVTFGGTRATVVSWSDTQIVVQVPDLPVGSHNVTVTTSAGQSNAVPFLVEAILIILVKNLGCDATSADTNAPAMCPNVSSGNLINNTTGNKYQTEQDYTGAGPFPLRWTRYYNSQGTGSDDIGANWSHSYSASIQQVSATVVHVVRADQKVLTFTLTGGVWTPDADVNARLVQLQTPQGQTTGWRYTTGEDGLETYDAAGRLLTLANRTGLTQTLAYDAQGRLTAVRDPFGRTLGIAYDSSNRINRLTDPAGGFFTYTYDSQNNLSSMTYPNGTTRTYLYQNTAFPHALTGIIDENGQPFATYTYDAQGRAVSSQHAGGAEKVTLAFDTAHNSTTVTDAIGTSRTYDYQTILGVARPSTATQPCPGCGSSTTHTAYDANGNVALVTDYNGNETTFTYDLTRNLETQRVEAVSTPQQRTITTVWHPTFRLITRIAEPLRITTYVYDDTGSTCGARGALCSKILQATTDTTGAQGFNATQTGSPRVWRYTYNSNGQIVTADGPRTNVADITTLTYDTQGNLTTITNALGHVTRITAYDVHGKPLTMQDPNGLVTTLTYDARQRLTSRTAGTETTTYAYNGVGQLTKVTLPDGSFLTYTYDAAHRLTQIQDSVGDKIVYTLDAIGNRIQEQVFDPSNTLTQTCSRIFDALSRLAQSIGAHNQPTEIPATPIMVGISLSV